MESYAKKTATKLIAGHHVLADLCQQVDRTGEEERGEAVEDNNISTFESIPRQDLPFLEVENDQEDELPPPVTDTNQVYAQFRLAAHLR